MYRISAESPVREVSFGEGMKISLNNYYDILKEQAGGLGAQEFLQLKLVADSLDITPNVQEGSYKWFSYYNMLRRSDLAIAPEPVSGTILTGAIELHDVYGKFLRRLRSLVVTKELSQEDQLKVNALDLEIDRNKQIAKELFKKDKQDWKEYCEIMGTKTGDIAAWVQWSSNYGQMREIQELVRKNSIKIFERKTILNKTYPDPDDQEIVDADIKFDDPMMRLCYPIHPDFEYSTPLTLEYLATLAHASTGLFDDRLVITWDKTLEFIKTANAGILHGEFSRTTSESSSISTDWSASGSVGFFFISVNASASEHTSIQEDFKKSTKITLDAKASLRININYGPWFKPNLFEHKRVKENPEMFAEFFGDTGLLLYYPTALVLVRGFGITFDSSQNWSFDYNRKFSASAGGGFNVFGINFGGSQSYGKEVTEHKVDQTGTSLKISDDEKTLRFVGYVVKKNNVLQHTLLTNVKNLGLV